MPEHPNLPPNSDKAKAAKLADKPQLASVVTSPVVQKKDSLAKRFRNIFITGDGRSVGRYIFGSVLVPAAKNMIVDAVTKGVDRVVYGDSPRPNRPNGGGYGQTGIYGRTQYSQQYRPDPRQMGQLPGQPPHVVAQSNSNLTFILATHDEAMHVLEILTESADKYGVCSVADLYQLLGLPFNHQDNKWGWTMPQMANVRQNRDGYQLTMPPAEPID